MKEQILLGKWTDDKLDHLLCTSSSIRNIGERISFISGQFLYTEYKESTLIGNVNTPEVLVINLEGVDCFTFLDYVEAMRITKSFSRLKENLKRVRYQSGKVAFMNRNHFFSDWQEFNSNLVENVTESTGIGKINRVRKILNRKDDGTFLLPGVPCREREIIYIPSEMINNAVFEKLKTGDYVGIYSEKPWLDVSHVGIVVKEKEKIIFRHASSASKHKKVIDEVFRNYIEDKPGIIVLRPKDLS